MAKTKIPRIIIEEATGKEYEFNPNALKEIIHSRINKKNHITQQSILQQIEDHCHLSADRVKNWIYGINGIGNFDNVKSISDFLKIDYHDILIDLNPTAEDENMISNEEKSIIRNIFGECISVVYKIPELTNLSKPTRDEKIANEKKSILEIDLLIRNIHMLVDQNSCTLQKYNRYNLHRFLLELNEYMYAIIKSDHSCIPERWEKISDFLSVEEAIIFPQIHNRNIYLDNPNTDDTHLYLLNEISLADKMGLTSCITPTDKEWDNFDILEDYHQFGYTPNNERYCLNPSIIWLDLIITVLIEIFETDFPHIFNEGISKTNVKR